MGYVPPPPPPMIPMPPCAQCGGSGYDDDSKSGALCPRGCRPWPDAGAVLREGIRRARITKLQRFMARVSWYVWPSQWAMFVLDLDNYGQPRRRRKPGERPQVPENRRCY